LEAMSRTEEKKVELMALGGSDLKFLFDREGVSEDFQLGLFEAGVVTIRQFAAIVSSTTELRKVLKEGFSLDSETDFASRAKVSRVLVAWESSHARASKMAEAEGISETRNETKPLANTDMAAMKTSFEAKWWTMEDDEVPAKSYMEKRLDMIEKSDLRAEPLSEVLAKGEDETDVLRTICDQEGNLKAVKVSTSIAMPASTEELRTRVTLLGMSWLLAGYQQTHRAYLAGLTPQLWQRYLKYLMGKFVLGLVAVGGNGAMVSAPTWSQLLEYEHAIRVEALRLVTGGMVLAAAMRAAWCDPVVKERHFTTPLALASHRIALNPLATYEPPNKKQKYEKDKGKGKASVQGERCAPSTPSGKRICFAYNSNKEKCKKAGQCLFEHVCGKCFEKHPMYMCSDAKKKEQKGGKDNKK
jgi:hypothetical protein